MEETMIDSCVSRLNRLDARHGLFMALALLIALPVFPAVTIKDSTLTWHTNNYSVGTDYGLISAQANTKVAKTINCKVIENEYLRIILETDLGCRILSMVYKPTNHEELYQSPCGVPYGIGAGSFYYDWLMVYGGIMPTFSEPEHGKFWIRPWTYQLVKQTSDTVSVSMSQKDTINFANRPSKFDYGTTGIECTFTLTVITGKSSIQVGVVLNNPAAQAKNYEYWTMTTLAPGSVPGNPRTTSGAEIITPIKNVDIPSSWTAIRGVEQNVSGDVYTFTKLRMWENWADEGIAYAWPDATTPLNTFWGVINHDNQEGIIRVCDNVNTIGLKIWSWKYSASVNASITSDSGTALPYLELWAGVSKMFFTPDNIGANQQKSWTEYFVPTLKLANVTHANENVVCNLTTDKTSYNASTDASVVITAQMFFTAPTQTNNISLSFGGTQTLTVLDMSVVADPLGTVITRTVPMSSLCNGLTKVTLAATSAQNAQLISADIPVTITNAKACSALDVRKPSMSIAPIGAPGAKAGKVYSINGKFLGEISSVSGINGMGLPRGAT